MSQSSTLDIGMDVPKDFMAVADVAQAHGAEVTSLGTLGTRPCDLDTLIRTMPSQAKPRRCVYEAGPWGSWLDRSLPHKGHPCGVVAPSLIPQKAGERVNTARRDAVPLARLMRAGQLTLVSVPTVDAEASRDRTRARADTLRDRKAAPWRLKAVWLRQDSP